MKDRKVKRSDLRPRWISSPSTSRGKERRRLRDITKKNFGTLPSLEDEEGLIKLLSPKVTKRGLTDAKTSLSDLSHSYYFWVPSRSGYSLRSSVDVLWGDIRRWFHVPCLVKLKTFKNIWFLSFNRGSITYTDNVLKLRFVVLFYVSLFL